MLHAVEKIGLTIPPPEFFPHREKFFGDTTDLVISELQFQARRSSVFSGRSRNR
jgi:hypothetical protein